MAYKWVKIVCDVFIFIVIGFVTLVVPFWKRRLADKPMTKAQYVYAHGIHVSLVSVIFSLARTTISMRSFLGYPSELFYRGSGMFEIIYGMMTALPLACFIFLPVFFRLRMTSVYHYLEMR